MALSAGVSTTYEQLTPQVYLADCEARINPSTRFALQAWVARVFAFCFPQTQKETEPMLSYLEPDAGAASPTTASERPPTLPVPPGNRPTGSGTPSTTPERVRHLLYGSLPALDRTIKILHALGYADPNDWSEPLPVPQGGVAPPAANAVEAVPPSAAEVAPPSGVEVAPPSAVEVAPPSAVEVAPPSAVEVAPPSAVEMVPPSAVEMVPPSAVEMVPPSAVEVWMVIMTKIILLE